MKIEDFKEFTTQFKGRLKNWSETDHTAYEYIKHLWR